MERSHDSIIDRLKKITQKVREIPNTVESININLSNVNENVNIPEKTSKNGILDFLTKKKKNVEQNFELNKSTIHQSTLSISNILKEFSTLNAFTGSISMKNDNSILFKINPFRFNAAPNLK